MDTYRTIYRPPSSRANSKPRALITRNASPEEEYAYGETDLGNPEGNSLFRSAMGHVATAATTAANALVAYGTKAIETGQQFGRDIINVAAGAATGEFPYAPGPTAQAAGNLATQLSTWLPQSVARAIGATPQPPDAGYIRTEDGREFRIPLADNATAVAEKALSDRAAASLRPPDSSVSIAQIQARIKSQELAQRESEFARSLQVKLRQEARNDEAWSIAKEIAEAQARAARPTQADLQNWWSTPSIPEKETAAPRRIMAIGSGVPGGLIAGPSRL